LARTRNPEVMATRFRFLLRRPRNDGSSTMRKLKLLLATAIMLASNPMPIAAQDSTNGSAATENPRNVTNPGWPPVVWFFDGRDDTRDFPTNGFFPGDFATDPARAAIGAAGLFGGTPRSGGILAPDGAEWQTDCGSCTRHRLMRARAHHRC